MYISTPRSNLLVRFMSVFLLWFSFSAFSEIDQTGKQKVTVIAKNETLESVFKQIEKQTGLRFMYATDAVDLKERVNVEFEKVALDEVLGVVFIQKRIEWGYRDGVIMLKQNALYEAQENHGLSLLLMTVSGKVLDANGDPVPGATIMIKGQKKGTRTNSDGIFILPEIEVNTILIVTHIGFETKEVVAKTKILNIKMSEKAGILDEAVIIGYGKTTQRYNTGNVSTIRADEISRNPVSDPLLALQGKIPGMVITQTTGLSGGAVKVQIRGQNSVRNGTTPLFIVDGVPYQPTVAVTTTFGDYGALGNEISALNFINPGDIESIDVLKDADATAIYGSRGANGVILITTKKGKMGDARLNFNINRGWQYLGTERKLLNTSEYLAMRREAFKNDNEVITTENAPDLLSWDTTRYTNWQNKLLGKSANYTDVQAGVSGGNDLVQYVVGGNYHKETTIFPGDFYSRRVGTHFNIVGNSIDQKFRSSLSGSFTTSKVNNPGLDFAANVNLPPNAPEVYNSNGSLNWANSTWENPFSKLLSNISEGQSNNLVGSIDLSYNFLEYLMFKINIGYNELRNNTFSANLLAGKSPAELLTATASANVLNSRLTSWISEPQIHFQKGFNKHVVNALLGMTLLGNSYNADFSNTNGFLQDALVRFPAAATSYFIRANSSTYKYLAFFGRFGYIYDSKYLLNLTIRRDGSSRFGPQSQFANFGSAGVGWIFSQESFFKEKFSFITFGKLRGSYGITGSDQIGDYQYLDRYDFVEDIYQGYKGLRVIGLFNPNFAWEKTKKLELGVEIGALKDRIFFTGSFYKNHSGNQLLSYELPSMVGETSVVGNLPVKVLNEGWELTLNSRNIQSDVFKWNTNLNISTFNNKLLSDEKNILGRDRVGKSLSTIATYKSIGVNEETGVYQFASVDGKPVPLPDADGFNTFIDLAPTLQGGVQNSIVYKSFQLDVFFQFMKRIGENGIYDGAWIPGSIRNQPKEVLNRWEKEGDNKKVQKYNQNGVLFESYSAWLRSSGNYSSATFIRCKNVMLSWHLPESMKKRLHVRDCSIYIQAQNLFTITKYPGWDPETLSTQVIPPLRVFTTGIQLTL